MSPLHSSSPFTSFTLSWWSRKECKELRRSLPSIAVKPPPPPAVAPDAFLGSFFEPRFSCGCCVVGVVWLKNDTKSQLDFGVRITKTCIYTYTYTVFHVPKWCCYFGGIFFWENDLLEVLGLFGCSVFWTPRIVGHAQKERSSEWETKTTHVLGNAKHARPSQCQGKVQNINIGSLQRFYSPDFTGTPESFLFYFHHASKNPLKIVHVHHLDLSHLKE